MEGLAMNKNENKELDTNSIRSMLFVNQVIAWVPALIGAIIIAIILVVCI